MDIACQDGRTALVEACRGGHLEVVRVLVKAGANVDVVWEEKDGVVWTLLPVAAQLGHVGIVKELIRGGANVLAPHSDGNTPLNFAAASSKDGCAGIVKALLEAGAEVDRVGRGKTGWPLSLASKNGNLDVVRELIKGGANLEKTFEEEDGFPLGVSISGGWNELTPVVHAANFGHMKVVKEILGEGAIPQRPRAGCNPEQRFLLFVKMLMEGQAKVDAASGDGAMLLRIACDKGFAGAVRVLITKGVSRHLKGADVAGENALTPLEAACR